MRHRLLFLSIGLLIVLGGYSLLSSDVIDAMAFSGRLVDGSGSPISGTQSVRLSIWNASSGGSELWNSGDVTVEADSDGRFETNLRDVPTTVLSDDWESGRWVEIKVGTNPPIDPRTLLPHEAYSIVTKEVKGKEVSVDDEGVVIVDVDTLDTLAAPWPRAALTDGKLELYEEFGFIRHSIEATTAGVLVDMFASRPTPDISIYPDGPNLNVLLPDDVIEAREILDEPGLAMNRRLSSQALDTTGMTTITAVSIDVPAPGYVMVQAKSIVGLDGGSGFGGVWLQIDTLAGGTADDISFALVGGDRSATGTAYGSTSLQRVYLVEPGVHTFFLEGQMVPGSTVGITAAAQASQVSALFIPTSYGGMVAKARVTEGIRPLRVDSLPGGEGLPEIRDEVFDLRELEQRLRDAERELLEARRDLDSLKKAADK